MQKPLIIGITGGIGGGKSMFSRYLMRRGELVYDTDMEAKILQESDAELRAKIKAEFGDHIYTAAGLNRAELAAIVFPNPEKLKKLTELVHPAVVADFKKWVRRHADRQFLFMECAILFEGKFDGLVDKVAVVTAPETVRMERIIKRDGTDKASVLHRMQHQMPESEKIKRADWVYDTHNNTPPYTRVDEFLAMLAGIIQQNQLKNRKQLS